MLNGVRIFTSDEIWHHILGELGAVIVDAPDAADLNMDSLKIKTPVGPLELKTIILNALDNSDFIRRIVGENAKLSRMQTQIIVWLHRRGAMNMAQLKQAMGYAPDVATHTIDTAIYQLRREFGRDFIINKNGVYSLGRV